MSQIKRFTTADGSHSLRIDSLDETYHSHNGAIQESQHVFIDEGLVKYVSDKDHIRIFEMGFGTGLNALLTWKTAIALSKKVLYYSIEKYPLNYNDIKDFNYSDMLDMSPEKFNRLHHAAWEVETKMDRYFTLLKMEMDLDRVQLSQEFDLVFYDAFGPRVQPNMWTREKLKVVYDALKVGGVLVTFCAQGQFRRNLKALGFHWESLPGPPGKREMTRAVKRS